MKSNKLFIAIATAIVLSSTTLTHADNNGIVFPPTDNSRIYQYPPQQPIPPMRPNTPYMFGQPSTATMPVPAMPPRNMRKFSNQNRTPYSMPNRFPTQRGSNQSRQNYPFIKNSSQRRNFSNNRGNNFNPFSGNSNPMNSMLGNNSNNSMPFFGNSNSMPFIGNNNNSMPFFGSNSNGNNFNSMPFFGNSNKPNKKRKKAWGKKRNIWPDFYTDFTDEAWDTASSGPRDLGRMPGGWRFPHISTPDPVTVTDAIANQFPPIMEEGGNMMDFSDWGVFD
ncbi:MAG: hypothetical protein V3U71_06720 [Cocleimonas sp.]